MQSPERTQQARVLMLVLVANAAFFGVELIGGLVFHSLALLADAAHMFSDVVGLAVALSAQRLMLRPPTARHSFGFQRAEVLGGHLNGLALLGVSAWILYSSVLRLGQVHEVDGTGMFVVGILGLLVNVFSAAALSRARGKSVNMRGAYLHMLADALSSIGAVLAAVFVIFGFDNADAVASMAIAALVAWASWGLVRDTTNVILEAAPRDMQLTEVEHALLSLPSVVEVHHAHVWNLASDVIAFSVHVVLEDVTTLHDAEQHVAMIKQHLLERFDIAHATIEVECHACES